MSNRTVKPILEVRVTGEQCKRFDELCETKRKELVEEFRKDIEIRVDFEYHVLLNFANYELKVL